MTMTDETPVPFVDEEREWFEEAPPTPADDQRRNELRASLGFAPVESDTGPDDEAPYGRFKNGKARKTPPKGMSTFQVSVGRKKSSKGPNYTIMAKGLVDLGSALVGMVGAMTKQPAIVADSAAIAFHGGSLAEGIGAAAEQDANIARFLERITKAGPYSAMLAPAVAIVAQILTNHQRVPVGTMGTIHPQALINHMTEQAG